MTDDDKQRASNALFYSLMESPQTFGSLWPIANMAMGFARRDHNAPGYRFTDRWLQTQRKAKRISLSGRVKAWELTESGKEYISALTIGIRT